MNKNSLTLINLTSKLLVSIAIILLGLYHGKMILLPFFFGLFLAILLYPSCKKLENIGIRRIFAILLVILTVFILLIALIIVLSFQMNNLISDLPSFQEKLVEFISRWEWQIQQTFGISPGEQIKWVKKIVSTIAESGGKLIEDALIVTTNIIAFIGLVPVYVFFFLLYRDNFKRFVIHITPRTEKRNTLKIIKNIQEVVKNYVTGLSIVILIIAVLNSTGLFILGIKYAFFLGVFSALLTIIPYLGVFIGGCIPVIVALLTKDSIWYPVGVIAIYAFIQFIEGNLITPNIVGYHVDINPLAAIFGLILGAVIWGAIGMILAVPFLAVLKITMYHFDALKPFTILLESNNKKRKQKTA